MKTTSVLLCLVTSLLLAPCVQAQSDLVKAYQKISDTEGGFTGILDNRDSFGGSIASLGDLDGDGVIDLAVGAPDDDDGGDDLGAVWVLFLNADGTVKAHQKISDTEGGFTGDFYLDDYFGQSVASLGDMDGDGVNDLAVGADGTEVVWVLFLNADGTVKTHEKIWDIGGGNYFGSSMASLGDLDGDGVSDLVVGDYDPDAPDEYSENRVWILFLNADGTLKAYRKISETEIGLANTSDDPSYFGLSVASLGDLDGDGVADIAVGASGDDGSDTPGAVWILFLNTDGTVKAHQRISSIEGGLINIDGHSITPLGDFDGDGTPDIVAGSRGAGWVLFLNADGTVKSYQEVYNTAGFGSSLALLGDVDNDNVPDIAVGASSDDDGGTNRGAVWVLFLNAAPPQDNTPPSCGSIAFEANDGTYEIVSSASDNIGIASVTFTRLTSNLAGFVDVGTATSGPFTQGDVFSLGSPAPTNVGLRARFTQPSGRFSFLVTVTDTSGNEAVCDPVVSNLDEALPETTALRRPYPNPSRPTFSTQVQVPFALAESANVHMVVYDLLGREVRVVVNAMMAAGTYEGVFDALGLSSGTYLVRLSTDEGFSQTQRFTVVE